MAKKRYFRIAKYAESLLLEARRVGKLRTPQMEEIRRSYNLLAYRLTAHNSAQANHVIRSVWYVVDSYLSTFPTQKEALAVLCELPAEEVWERGLQTLRRLSYEVTFLSIRMRRGRLDLPNIPYQSAGEIARRFLTHYHPRIGAHKTSMQIPYTPIVGIPRQTGLYYLRLYLMFLSYEDDFCRDCGMDAVLDSFGFYALSRPEFDMEFSNVNIYKILFINAIFAHYLNYEPDVFLLRAEDATLAEKLLRSLSPAEQRDALRQVVLRLPYGNLPYNLCAFTTLFPILQDAIAHERLRDCLLIEPT